MSLKHDRQAAPVPGSSSRHAPREIEDRRGIERRPLDVYANRFVQGRPYLCRTADISREGMRVYRFSEPSGPPPVCGLQFQLPGSADIINAGGEVVFADDESGAVGIRFTHLSKFAVDAIAGYLQRAQVD